MMVLARYFADQGWKDILIAFPVNILMHEEINQLANEIALQILVIDRAPLEILGKKIDSEIGVKIELDLGSNRSGFLPNQFLEIEELLSFIESHPLFNFTGFY